MKDSIRLSKEHGLAPCLTVCMICGKDAEELVLLGAQADKIKDFGNGTRMRVSEPCNECKARLKEGAPAFLCDDSRVVMITAEASLKYFDGQKEKVGRIWRMTPETFNQTFGHLQLKDKP